MSTACCHWSTSVSYTHLDVYKRQGFLYAFFPFMFGIYPYTAVTEQQRTAMELAGVGYVRISVRELTRSFTAKLLQGFQM